jgi:hypothetical protein
MRNLALFALLLASGCSDDSSTIDSGAPAVDGGVDAAVAIDASTGADATPLPPACTAPTFAAAFSVTPTAGNVVAPQLAPGAVAYLNPAGGGGARVYLQRLTATGAASGDLVEVASSAGLATGAGLALATDGTAYVACWGPEAADSSIHCATVPASSGAATAGVTIAGSSPALVHGAGGIILAYASGGSVLAQHLGADAQTVGDPATIAAAHTAVVAAETPTGYAFAVGPSGPALIRTDAGLGVVGSSLGLPAMPAALAASGEVIGLVFDSSTDNMAKVAVVSAAGALSTPANLETDDSTTYGRMDISAAGDGFAVSWSSYMGYIGYRAVDLTGAPLGAVTQPIAEMWDDNDNSIIPVADGFLVAANTDMDWASLKVAHLTCP